MGDRLLIGFVAALLAFMVGLSIGYGDVVNFVRTFPAPTESWATIITGLAWPVVALVLVSRWGGALAVVAANLARRFEKEGFKTPWLEMPGTAVQPNDPTRDMVVLRLSNGAATQATAAAWLKANLPVGVSVLDFATQPD